ncbi:MAG TPA: cell wall-binding repeat-containing protein [Acidimicrobiales bacterium]|nr:cell wall-binding repeat-containing protein [Acidimicrobiales bacterium]
MKRAMTGITCLLVVLSVAPPAHAQAIPADFTFRGSGFGHGVGMSQYGAYGQALEGRSSGDILRHYYSGTSITPANDAQLIRVNLLASAERASVRGESLGEGGGSIRISAGEQAIELTANQVANFGRAGDQVTVTVEGPAVMAQPITAPTVKVTWSAGPTLLNVIGPGETFDTRGHRYRYGELDVAIAPTGTGLQVVNLMSLHTEYLRGIAEVPSSWPSAALEAQAITARTFALQRVQSGQRTDCLCHVRDTVADQVFAGWVKESEEGFGQRWVAAVDATQPDGSSGLVVTKSGALATTTYFSSSGGSTESNTDGFGSTTPFTYLQPVDDRWSLASYNPFASWSFTRSQDAVKAAFNEGKAANEQLKDVVSINLTDRTAGGSLRTAVATASDGMTLSLGGATFRSRLQLPARWIGTPVVRVSGSERYSTSVAAGRRAPLEDPKGTVVIASGETAHLVDGLVAAPLAAVEDAPLLLSAATGLPDPVGDEVARLGVTRAVLVGGQSALSEQVVTDLRARGVQTVERIFGSDRFDTGLQVARAMGAPRSVAVIASGESGRLADALASGGPAAATGRPILLVTRDAVPLPTRQALTEMGTSSTIVIGGSAAISDSTAAQLPNAQRVSGADRYSTSAAVADHFSPEVGLERVVLSSGDPGGLVDALPGGAIQAITLLTNPGMLPPAAQEWLARNDAAIGSVDVIGGPNAVTPQTFNQARAAVY